MSYQEQWIQLVNGKINLPAGALILEVSAHNVNLIRVLIPVEETP